MKALDMDMDMEHIPDAWNTLFLNCMALELISFLIGGYLDRDVDWRQRRGDENFSFVVDGYIES